MSSTKNKLQGKTPQQIKDSKTFAFAAFIGLFITLVLLKLFGE